MKKLLISVVLLLSCVGAEPAAQPAAPPWQSPALAERRTDAFWLARLPPGEADRVLLDGAGIARLNAGYRGLEDGPRVLTSDQIADVDLLRQQITSAFTLIEQKAARGELTLSGERLREAKDRAADAAPIDEYRIAADELTLWCIPTSEPILKNPGGTVAFDRNRCSEVHFGEAVRVLARASDGWSLVRASYAIGWVSGGGALGPVMSKDEVVAYLDGPRRLVVTKDHPPAGAQLRLGTTFPAASDDTAMFWRAGAWHSVGAGPGLETGPLPFTRRNALRIALSHLGSTYGWGGFGEGMDCSRFLQAVLATFGIALPRNSVAQASHGSNVSDVKGRTRAEKLDELRRASRCGLVVLQMPGHIMLYLGEEAEDGTGAGSFAVSSVGEVTRPCTSCNAGSPDEVIPINRVEVTSLATGHGTARGSWLDRLERVVTLGECDDARPAR